MIAFLVSMLLLGIEHSLLCLGEIAIPAEATDAPCRAAWLQRGHGSYDC
jgi:hypothetical protein